MKEPEDEWTDAETAIITSPISVDELLTIYASREESLTYPVIWAINKEN